MECNQYIINPIKSSRPRLCSTRRGRTSRSIKCISLLVCIYVSMYQCIYVSKFRTMWTYSECTHHINSKRTLWRSPRSWSANEPITTLVSVPAVRTLLHAQNAHTIHIPGTYRKTQRYRYHRGANAFSNAIVVSTTTALVTSNTTECRWKELANTHLSVDGFFRQHQYLCSRDIVVALKKITFRCDTSRCNGTFHDNMKCGDRRVSCWVARLTIFTADSAYLGRPTKARDGFQWFFQDDLQAWKLPLLQTQAPQEHPVYPGAMIANYDRRFSVRNDVAWNLHLPLNWWIHPNVNRIVKRVTLESQYSTAKHSDNYLCGRVSVCRLLTSNQRQQALNIELTVLTKREHYIWETNGVRLNPCLPLPLPPPLFLQATVG